ncbi:MAG: (d)CMP kinase [Gammaproteobacteria bacterium]|nr:MAG: (d)CMP kinase [Gammaproteobacteria bacterium]
MAEVPVITVDGPGGAGKGTLCVALARELGWHLLDSGALYRLVALAAEQRDVAFDDSEALAEVARHLDVSFELEADSDQTRVILEGQPVADAMRSDAAGQGASQVAAIPAVRSALVDRQRAFRRAPGLIADGRDMGTVIFPDAELKVFLTASTEERARRRYKQLIDKGLDANLRDLFASMAARDERDAQRAVAPLRPADDALVIDSTSVDAEGVLAQVLAAARSRGIVQD